MGNNVAARSWKHTAACRWTLLAKPRQQTSAAGSRRIETASASDSEQTFRMLRESRMNTQEQNVQLIVHGTTDRVGIDARRRDGGGSSCPFVADGVCPARADGRGLSARSRALTPLCELGVSGSGVGESRSVGRVSSRAGPRGRWGGCQKTILSKLAGRQTFSIWVYGQAKGHVCGTETSYLLRSTHNTSTFIYVPIPCSMGMESRRTQPGRARAGLDRAPRAPRSEPLHSGTRTPQDTRPTLGSFLKSVCLSQK